MPAHAAMREKSGSGRRPPHQERSLLCPRSSRGLIGASLSVKAFVGSLLRPFPNRLYDDSLSDRRNGVRILQFVRRERGDSSFRFDTIKVRERSALIVHGKRTLPLTSEKCQGVDITLAK